MNTKTDQKADDSIGIAATQLFIAVIGFGLALWLWPWGIMDVPIGSLTLWMLGRAAMAVMTASCTCLILWASQGVK